MNEVLMIWNRDDDPHAWTWKHRERLVIVEPDPFAGEHFDAATFELRAYWNGVRSIYYWDRRATYILVTRYPDRMRAWLRLQGGYAVDGEAPSTTYRDFAENIVAAIRVDCEGDIARLLPGDIADLRNTQAARKSFLIGRERPILLDYAATMP